MDKIKNISMALLSLTAGALLAAWFFFCSLPFLIFLLTPLVLIIPTRVLMGARFWPANGWDGVVSHLGRAVVFILAFNFPIFISMGIVLHLLFESYKDLILTTTLVMVGLNFIICNILIARWSVHQERHNR